MSVEKLLTDTKEEWRTLYLNDVFCNNINATGSLIIPSIDVPSLTAGTGTITNLFSTVASIQSITGGTATFNVLRAQEITGANAYFGNATINNATIFTGTIIDLVTTVVFATGANIDFANVSTTATIGILVAGTGTINNLTAGTATITNLVAGTSTITNLVAETGTFDTLNVINANISTGTISSSLEIPQTKNLVFGRDVTGAYFNINSHESKGLTVYYANSAKTITRATSGAFSILVPADVTSITGGIGNFNTGIFSSLAVSTMSGNTGVFNNLIASTASINNLSSISASFGTATVSNLVIDDLSITNLSATTFTGTTVRMGTGIFGTMTGSSLVANALYGKNQIISDDYVQAKRLILKDSTLSNQTTITRADGSPSYIVTVPNSIPSAGDIVSFADASNLKYRALTGSSNITTTNETNTFTIATKPSVFIPTGSFTTLIAGTATISNLNIGTATFTSLVAGTATVTNLILNTNTIATTTGNLSLPTGTQTLVGRDTTDTLTNKTLTAPLMTTIIRGAGTLTLPTITDTLVTKTSTDFMKNKTLSGLDCFFVDNTDNSKQLKFIMNNSTGVQGVLRTNFTTAKTLELPDATDTLLGRNTTDTVNNKSLTETNNFVLASDSNRRARIICENTGGTTMNLRFVGTTNNINHNVPDCNVNTSFIMGTVASGSQTINNNLTAFQLTLSGWLKLPTAGGTQSELKYYEQGVAFSSSVSGPWAAKTMNIRFSRIGNTVTMTFTNDDTSTNATSTNEMTLATAIPSRFRPLIATVQQSLIIMNVNRTMGQCFINSDGTVIIGPLSGGFNIGSPAGWVAQTLTYEIVAA